MPSQTSEPSSNEKNFTTPEYVPTYFTNETVVEEARIKRMPKSEEIDEDKLPEGIER